MISMPKHLREWINSVLKKLRKKQKTWMHRTAQRSSCKPASYRCQSDSNKWFGVTAIPDRLHCRGLQTFSPPSHIHLCETHHNASQTIISNSWENFTNELWDEHQCRLAIGLCTGKTSNLQQDGNGVNPDLKFLYLFSSSGFFMTSL